MVRGKKQTRPEISLFFEVLRVLLAVIYGFVVGSIVGYVCDVFGVSPVLAGALIGGVTGMTTLFIFAS